MGCSLKFQSPTQKLNEIEEEPHHAQQAHGHPSHHHGHHSPHKHGHHHGHHGPGLIDSHALRERYKAFDTVGRLQASHLMTAYDLSSFKSAVDLGGKFFEFYLLICYSARLMNIQGSFTYNRVY